MSSSTFFSVHHYKYSVWWCVVQLRHEFRISQWFCIAKDLPKSADGKVFLRKSFLLFRLYICVRRWRYSSHYWPFLLPSWHLCVSSDALLLLTVDLPKMLQVSCHSPVSCYFPVHCLCGSPLGCFRLLAWHSVTHHSVFSDPSGKMGSHPHFLVKLCLSSCTCSHVL